MATSYLKVNYNVSKTYQRCWRLRLGRWHRCWAVRSTCEALWSSLWNILVYQRGSSVWGWRWLRLWRDLMERGQQTQTYYWFCESKQARLLRRGNENKLQIHEITPKSFIFHNGSWKQHILLSDTRLYRTGKGLGVLGCRGSKGTLNRSAEKEWKVTQLEQYNFKKSC